MPDDTTVRDMLFEVACDVKWIRESLDEIKETHDELEERVRELEGWRREHAGTEHRPRLNIGALLLRLFGL
ncbi:hypothetical protein [Methanofollis fontis]|uniref:Uncharacterized protein n=1 Tax=Methanofollis fontis TaxID=2052832 RepID=A0A483CX30_9EURY|nr:hypothetical protein [Methanofollis fontis]TAJ43632.1 hypothetical protein CUJ86_09810 [Methanofollis fontis]